MQASLVKTEGAVFQKGTNFNVCVPRDLKGQRVRWQVCLCAFSLHPLTIDGIVSSLAAVSEGRST